ncbi:hypothetical protein DFH08DRAFT_824190 [Mycena albidolilacea]|uniref:Secreted protein n=1 Tax=Mycena albidolilacea TaxID=1033008 RepID=A0AAD6Z559_9AGAR|nr:hypothetical protein DFH08DRAFT_824190 [Mycena albidolilacea]
MIYWWHFLAVPQLLGHLLCSGSYISAVTTATVFLGSSRECIKVYSRKPRAAEQLTQAKPSLDRTQLFAVAVAYCAEMALGRQATYSLADSRDISFWNDCQFATHSLILEFTGTVINRSLKICSLSAWCNFSTSLIPTFSCSALVLPRSSRSGTLALFAY